MFRDSTDGSTASRRRFLARATATGIAAIVPGVDRATASGRIPMMPPSGDVTHTHFGELPTVQRQIRRYRAGGDPTALYNPGLRRHLRRHPDQGTLDLVVRTVGERRVAEMAGSTDRTIRGWRPSPHEVERLSRFGGVGFVASVASTTVSLRDVAREDLSAIAALPFVLDVDYDPPLSLEDTGPESASDGIPLADLRGEDYFCFSGLPDDVSLPSWLRIGIVDRGYGGAGDFDRAHAEAVGIDEELAADFTGEHEWRTDDGHGSNVANTCAAMLPDGHEDLFVPLKVIPSGDTPSRIDVRDNVRAAIEYAERTGIDVLNVSLGTTTRRICPSAYCAELHSYVDAGFLPFAAVGNRNATGVEFPGGEWCTIGVGGIAGDCTGDGSHRRFVGEDGYYGSSYDSVIYRDPFQRRTYCHYCRHRCGHDGSFSPSVYGCYLPETDAGETLAGTSYASPQAAAVGAILQGQGHPGFDEVTSVFRDMDRHEICPGDVARAGQLLDAEYAFDAIEEV